jgi:hypothetical protein
MERWNLIIGSLIRYLFLSYSSLSSLLFFLCVCLFFYFVRLSFFFFACRHTCVLSLSIVFSQQKNKYGHGHGHGSARCGLKRDTGRVTGNGFWVRRWERLRTHASHPQVCISPENLWSITWAHMIFHMNPSWSVTDTDTPPSPQTHNQHLPSPHGHMGASPHTTTGLLLLYTPSSVPLYGLVGKKKKTKPCFFFLFSF